MAKKKQETASLIETFAEFKQNKNIDLTTMVGVLEESFRSVIAKIFGSDENFDVIVNPDKPPSMQRRASRPGRSQADTLRRRRRPR